MTNFNATECPIMDAIPINLMTVTKQGTKIECAFGSVLVKLLAHIWNLHITIPNQDIAMNANDVKSCFC